MTRQLFSFPGGLKLETWKTLSNSEVAIQAPSPERLIIPLQQHIGLPAEPCVRAGERVLRGQVIARAQGYVSVPIHASTSGTVAEIAEHPVPHPSGRSAPCIVIERDGRDEWIDLKPIGEYASLDPAILQQAICDAGIVGLGGAGFPAHVKICEGVENQVDTLIINGVECEPYITCDDRLIREKAHYVVAGTRMIGHAVQARHRVIAVEEDMDEAYAALAGHIGEDIELVQVPRRYPAGGEKQLIKVLTGKEVPSLGLAIHIGVVMQNVATAAAAYRAVTRGEPVISRYVTVTGAVPNPRNLQVLIGTPVRHCLELCGYQDRPGLEVIIGGPMMGIPVSDLDMPVTKTTNCILVREVAPRPPELPCIRCGDCAEVCPVNLMPQQLYRFAREENHVALRDHHLFDCIECGCCAYVCPSHIPLVQYYRHAKAAIAAEERAHEGADHARARFLARNERLAREHAADGDQQASAHADNEQERAAKQAYIQEAVARTHARRARTDQTSVDNGTSQDD
jgi:electron transport complex protein RnfC